MALTDFFDVLDPVVEQALIGNDAMPTHKLSFLPW